MVNTMNQLVIIENGQLDAICLDDRNCWEVGRGSGGFRPDIRLHSPTVSRRHGRFQNMDGCWFYVDYAVKNRTFHNGRQLRKGLGGKSKPAMLRDGDVFVFGCADVPVINEKTVWALYLSHCRDSQWRAADTRGIGNLSFTDGQDTRMLQNPDKGTVVNLSGGLAIYMGDLTYLHGQITLGT